MKKTLFLIIISFFIASTGFANENSVPLIDFDFSRISKNKVTSVCDKNIVGIAPQKIKSAKDNKIGQYIIFDKNTCIQIDNESLAGLKDKFSISLTAKLNYFKGWQTLAAKESWNARTGWLIVNTYKYLKIFINSKQTINIRSPFLDKKWHSLAVIFDKNKVQVYVDAKKVAEKEATPEPNTVSMIFGARHGNNGTGQNDALQDAFIADIKVFNGVLNKEQITKSSQ